MMSTLAYYPQSVHAMAPTGRSNATPRIDIRIDIAASAGQEIVKGVLSYARRNTSWRVSLPARSGRKPATRGERCEGVLAQVNSAAQLEDLLEKATPVVNVCGDHTDRRAPRVAHDEAAVARLAIDHLTDLGFQHLGVCAWSARRSSTDRAAAFRELAEIQGAEVTEFLATGPDDWEKGRDAMAEWLAAASRPLGVLACDDALGQQLLDACRAAGLRAPEDVAVLGVGNDELICDVADPPMSSVALDHRRIGFEAAKRLHRLIESPGKRVSGVRVPPIDVASRPSTDALVIEDKEVAAAATFIRENALRGIKVADVLEAVPMSRRVLETRFRGYFGRTLHQEILGVQVNAVKQMLRDTDLSMAQIAARCGFRHVEYMSVVFKREVGSTPSGFRQRTRDER